MFRVQGPMKKLELRSTFQPLMLLCPERGARPKFPKLASLFGELAAAQ